MSFRNYTRRQTDYQAQQISFVFCVFIIQDVINSIIYKFFVCW